jgi:ATP-dependent protease HslVU (ClpYQ) peptidase subunit
VTAILAVVRKGHATMGADRAVSDENEIWTTAEPKIVRRGQWLIGAAGGFGGWYTMLRRLPRDVPPKTEAMREAFRELAQQIGGAEPFGEMSVLVLCPGRIHMVESDGSLYPVAERVSAVGSGGPVAAAHYAAGGDIRAALRYAAKTCIGVRGPFDVLQVNT